MSFGAWVFLNGLRGGSVLVGVFFGLGFEDNSFCWPLGRRGVSALLGQSRELLVCLHHLFAVYCVQKRA